MKKFKFLAVLMLLAVIPFIGVNAQEYNAYTAGTIRNFYSNEDEEKAGREGSTDVGLSAIILEDSTSSSQYVRAMAHHVYYGDNNFDAATFETSKAYRELIGKVEEWGITDPYIKVVSESGNLDLISLQELIDVFGATYDATTDTYSIDPAVWGNTFRDFVDEIAILEDTYTGDKTPGLGFYTNTVSGTDVWTVVFGVDADTNITSIKVQKVALNANAVYASIPVLYFNKTYDCKNTIQAVSACYSCGDDYTWTEVGTQASTCTLVENINSKADCVKPVTTGIEDYSLQIIACVAVGALALVLLKKKSLFKQV